jgi:3D-(3,5/4)-trihydroxycyclohexane-1,2-dione acylhydrolase (decyclizing)
VVRYWDRIVSPEQVVQSLPAAVSTMLDPGTAGPAFLALPQDVQAESWDFPLAFFEPTVRTMPRPRAAADEISAAEDELQQFAERHSIPVVETVSGKAALLASHPLNAGPVGVTGCTSANELAARADVVVALGTRLQDFTTGSWTIFKDEATRFIGINTTRFDAIKHRSLPVVGDARESIAELDSRLSGWKSEDSWVAFAREETAKYHAYIDSIASLSALADDGLPTYAQVVGVVDRDARPNDYVLTAAGGFPGELNNGWRAKHRNSFDCEYGFSCMGYEISGAWGAKMALPGSEVISFVGDGSYLMMNSDLYSTVLNGHKVIFIVCDNGGYAVIRRLQVNQGGRPFNNQLEDCQPARLTYVDFAMHAAAMGATTETVQQITDLPAALQRARQHDSTYVIVMKTSPNAWTEGGSFWEVGVPETSHRPEVVAAGEVIREAKKQQRVGW